MSTVIDKEEILENLANDAHEMYTNDGIEGEQAWILARKEALYRYNNDLYYTGDYEVDD